MGLEATVDQFDVKVQWPGGGSEWFDDFQGSGIVTLMEGSGKSDP